MKESEKMIVVTDPRPWKTASDQEVEKPVGEGDRKNPDDHAGPPPADLRLPADELDERLQREGDQGRGENRDEHGCGEVEEGDHPAGRQECEPRAGRSGKRCALHSNTLLFFTSRAIRILWYECRKRRAGRVEAGGTMATASHTIEIRVRFGETDPYGVAYFAAILDYFKRGLDEFLRSRGLSPDGVYRNVRRSF